MDALDVLGELGLTGTAYAAPVSAGEGAGVRADDLVTPASVMKVQIALAVESAIAEGSVDGFVQRVMPAELRTPGPVGISLMQDEVSMSVRDLVLAMLTISDNAATDELINVIGLDPINRATRALGMTQTHIASNLREMLDALAEEVGFQDYRALAAHDPDLAGPPSTEEIRRGMISSAVFDPTRGTRTTATETVMLLQGIWTDRAGPPQACAAVRTAMAQQLTRSRIASGFGPAVTVAAKSGGLMGIARNEAGVVTFPDGTAYAVAVFTRNRSIAAPDPAKVDACIGRIARAAIDQLRNS